MRVFYILWAACLSLHCNSLQLKDVKNINEILFENHLIYDSFNEQVISRSIKNVTNHLDPTRFYFYEADLQEFSGLQGKIKIEYEYSKFDSYLYMRDVFANRVKTVRRQRARIYRDVISGKISYHNTKPYRNGHPLSTEEQKDRVTHYLCSHLNDYAQAHGKKGLSVQEKKQCLLFLERKLQAHEERHLNEDKFPLFLSKMIASSLDAHSSVFDSEEIVQINAKLRSRMTGIGVQIVDTINGPVVFGCIKGGPAHKSGKIFKGDRISHINGVEVSTMSYEKVMHHMTLSEGQTVLLGLRTKNGQKKVVKLTAERIQIDTQRIVVTTQSFLDGHIACLKVDTFYNDFNGVSISADMKKIIQELQNEKKLYGLIIDLRENLGGYFVESVKTIDLFTDKGSVVVAKFRNDDIRFSKEYDPHKVYGGPIVALTSKYSASAAEVLAQSLQDTGAAIIAGDHCTFGKGSIQYQTITDPRSRYKYKVTIGKYYTVSGRTTQLEGVKADVHVPTKYSNKKIGERHLTYALPSDSLSHTSKMDREVQQIFSYHSGRPKTAIEVMKPHIVSNSKHRIKKNKNYQAFLASLDVKGVARISNKEDLKKSSFGKNDLQMSEAFMIIKDMHLMLQTYQK